VLIPFLQSPTASAFPAQMWGKMALKPLSTSSRVSPSDETRTPFWKKSENHDLVKSEDSSKDTVSQNPLIDHPCENCLPKLDYGYS
jgi:hypothetical protein